MSNILLLCASGVTSSLLAQKLNRIVENDLNGYNLITCSICDVARYAVKNSGENIKEITSASIF